MVETLLPLNAKERKMLRFVAMHSLCGLAAGLTFGLAVLYTNLGNLRTLALESTSPIMVLGLFFFGLFVTFGSVGMGVGIMALARDEERELE